MAKLKKPKIENTTTALYNLRKRIELSKKTGSGKAAADKAARERPIKEMKIRSAQIKADIKKRTTSAVEKAKKPDATKRQQSAYIPKNKQATRSNKQKAAIAIKYKKK